MREQTLSSILKPFRHHSLIIFLTVIVLFVSGISQARPGVCQDLFKPEPPSIYSLADGSWRKTAGDLFMGFRSNAPHFWRWVAAQESPLFSFKGVVVGDPHLLNFGDIALANGQFRYGLIDMDDGGIKVPLIADFIRDFAGTQIAPFKVHGKELFSAYLDGLQRKSMDKPKYLKDLEKSYEDFEHMQKSYVSRLTKKDRFSADARVESIESAAPEIRDLFKRSEMTLRRELQEYEILDVGYRVKETGGSQGLPRFWFLVEKEGTRHILEFKLLTAPATAQYKSQPSVGVRFKVLTSLYRPQQEALGPFKVVYSGRDSFHLRERLAHFIDLAPENLKSKKEIKDAQEMSIYQAYKMGIWQSANPSAQGLLEALSTRAAFDEVSDLAARYTDLMIKESQ